MHNDKQVVITTGASRGIGLTASRLLLAGTLSIPASRVVTLSRSRSPALDTLANEFPDDLVIVQGDVTTQEDNNKAVRTAVNKWGRLDGLILNAGIVSFGHLAEQASDVFEQVLRVNLYSLQLSVRAAVPYLRQAPSGQGKVVIVSSGAAVSSRPAWGAYNISKAGANAFARTLASEELGVNGNVPIAVWSIRPGQVDTPVCTARYPKEYVVGSLTG